MSVLPTKSANSIIYPCISLFILEIHSARDLFVLPSKLPMDSELGSEGGIHTKLAGVDNKVFRRTQKS